MSPNQSAIGQWDWGFHTLRGDIDPRIFLLQLGVVRVGEILKDFRPGDGNESSPGVAGPRRWPETQSSRRAGATRPSQPAIGLWDSGFHPHRGGIDPGDLPLRPRVVVVGEIWNEF